MTDRKINRKYPLNPNFGEGIFRRRIRLVNHPNKVIAELEDCCHGFRSTVYHDGKNITDIQAESIRTPLSTCVDAVIPIRAMIGLPLTTKPTEIGRTVNPKSNCTHLYDLTILAISHCLRDTTIRQYDIAVDDEGETPTTVTVHRDGIEILNWKIKQWTVSEPTPLQGKPLHKGFASWAKEVFCDDELEAAFVLQKGYFVAQARIIDIDKLAGSAAADYPSLLGVCYTYSPEVVNGAIRNANTARDFTDTPEKLLKFL